MNLRHRIRTLIPVGLACAAALISTDAPAQAPVEWRFFTYFPVNDKPTQLNRAFAEDVGKATNGRLKITVLAAGELPFKAPDVLRIVSTNQVQMGDVALGFVAGDMPALNVLQLPFLYQDAGQMWRVLDGSIGDEFLTRLDAIDLTGLSWFDAGVRSFYTREKVTGLDDLQGLTIRVQESDMMSEMITALGAKPAQVVYSKVYAALHNAEIDGAENNWPSYEVMGHYEVAPFFLKDEHTRVPEV